MFEDFLLNSLKIPSIWRFLLEFSWRTPTKFFENSQQNFLLIPFRHLWRNCHKSVKISFRNFSTFSPEFFENCFENFLKILFRFFLKIFVQKSVKPSFKNHWKFIKEISYDIFQNSLKISLGNVTKIAFRNFWWFHSEFFKRIPPEFLKKNPYEFFNNWFLEFVTILLKYLWKIPS